ncbi:MAG: hypothetical protein KDD02_04200 [Phaeodactylibacter sp.]|nr:hypothetical protein [Phaeodactylibacter sp.]
MVKKLAILIIFLLVGASLSPLMVNHCSDNKAFPPLAAEEATTDSFTDGPLLFDVGPEWDGPLGTAGLLSWVSPLNRPEAIVFSPRGRQLCLPVTSRLFLLFHAFLFYDFA